MRSKSKLIVKAGFAAAALAFAAGPQAAFATPGVEDEQDGQSAQSDTEIVVTAQKREERLNDVPMSLTAATGETLTKLGVSNPDDLAKIVTGFVYSKSAYGVPVYTLRGVGFYDYSLAAVPAVTIYVDEVPLPYSKMGAFASLDLERVEILKGPQGTLYGQNSTGGAINYIAAKPSESFDAGVDFSYGRFHALELKGFVSGPLSETLSTRIAFNHQSGGDWQYSSSRFDTLGRKNISSVRALLDWKPSSNFLARLNLNVGRDTSDTQAGQYQGITTLNPTASTLIASRPALVNFPRPPANARAADWDVGVPLRRDDRQYQAALTLRYDVSPEVQLTSITSFVNLDTASTFDGDGTPFVNIYGDIDGNAKSFYQELRLLGETGGLQWIVGANYGKQKVREEQFGTYYDDYIGILGITRNQNGGEQEAESKAVYANLNYTLAGQLTFEGGIRYTDESHSFAGCTRTGDAATALYYTNRYGAPVALGDCITTLPPPGGGWGLYTAAFKEDNISWRTGLNWKPSAGTMLYATVSRGYKGGSFPLTGASNYYQLRPILQESLLAYESGFKLTLFDNLLQLNAAGFYYDYTDKQIRGKAIQPETLASVAALVAIPKSEVVGAELQATVRPAPGFTFGLDATYADSKIKGPWVNFDFYGYQADFGGEAIPYSPKWSLSSRADYEFRVVDGWKGAIGGHLRYQSSSNAGLGEQPVAYLPSFTTIDLRAGIETDDDRFAFSIWGRNVTDKYYWNNVILVLGAVARYAAPPATYGISASFRY